MRQGRTLRLLLLVPLYFAAMVLLHELGHALTAGLLIPGEVRLYVWPGVELLPDVGREFPETWPARIPAMTYVRPEVQMQWTYTPGIPPYVIKEAVDGQRIERNHNITKLMGSTITLLFSLASLGLIALLKPEGFARRLLAAGSLFHVDILLGTEMPYFDARHLYFWGSERPEALDALADLGAPPSLAAAAILTVSLLELVALYRLMGRRAHA